MVIENRKNIKVKKKEQKNEQRLISSPPREKMKRREGNSSFQNTLELTAIGSFFS